MDSFVTVLVICLISGLAFLLGSLIVVTRLPRTAAAVGGATAITWNGITVKTANVFVALSMVSAALALVVPSFAMWLDSKVDDNPVFLRATLPPPRGSPFEIVHRDDQETTSSLMEIVLFKSRSPQLFAVSTKSVRPVNITASYAWLGHQVLVKINDREPQFVRINGVYADLGALPFANAPAPGMQSIRATAKPAPAVPAAVGRLADPLLPGGAP
jgi:hypothetical protein